VGDGSDAGKNTGMDDESPSRALLALTSTADRLDALAETAELMGDDAGACRFRERASACRMQAMLLLDD
jgi:hypothetical protein